MSKSVPGVAARRRRRIRGTNPRRQARRLTALARVSLGSSRTRTTLSRSDREIAVDPFQRNRGRASAERFVSFSLGPASPRGGYTGQPPSPVKPLASFHSRREQKSHSQRTRNRTALKIRPVESRFCPWEPSAGSPAVSPSPRHRVSRIWTPDSPLSTAPPKISPDQGSFRRTRPPVGILGHPGPVVAVAVEGRRKPRAAPGPSGPAAFPREP